MTLIVGLRGVGKSFIAADSRATYAGGSYKGPLLSLVCQVRQAAACLHSTAKYKFPKVRPIIKIAELNSCLANSSGFATSNRWRRS